MYLWLFEFQVTIYKNDMPVCVHIALQPVVRKTWLIPQIKVWFSFFFYKEI